MFNLLRYSKGGLSLSEIEDMPIPRVFHWLDIAESVATDEHRAMKAAQREK